MVVVVVRVAVPPTQALAQHAAPTATTSSPDASVSQG